METETASNIDVAKPEVVNAPIKVLTETNNQSSKVSQSSNSEEENVEGNKHPASEFQDVDINEPSGKSTDVVVNPGSLGLSVVENITSLGRRYSLKEWSKSTFVYTKQLLSENFGFGTKTVDVDLERQIDMLEESKKACNSLHNHCQNISKSLAALTLAQKEFGMVLSEMSLKGTYDYKQEMACNGEMFKSLHKSNIALEGVINMFCDNMATLSNKTIEDCILSIRQYDAIRMEYDAYRVQYEESKKHANGNEAKISEAEQKFRTHRDKFNKTRADLCTKMKLVEENKNKVLKRNLMILQEALMKRTREAGDNLGEISSHYEFKPTMAHSWLENNE